MPYCFNCGKPVIETDRFCASCGAELYLRKSATQDSERRFPTPPFASPEQTQHPSRTRLLTPDSKGTDQTRDYGKTRLIDPDREESEPTPVSGKTRLMSEEDIARLKAKDTPPFAKPLPQQIEEHPHKQAPEGVTVGASITPWWTKSWFLLVLGFVAFGLFGLMLFGLGVFDDKKPQQVGVQAEDIEIPDLTNMSFAEATTLLGEKGLKYKKVDEYSEVTVGFVVGQNPKPGRRVRPGQVIELTVSAGPQMVSIPNVTGMSKDEAEKILRNVGLAVGGVTEKNDHNVPKGSVISQAPQAGKQVQRGTKIDLLVSLGREETTPPLVKSELVLVEVPDLTNWTFDSAIYKLERIGLSYELVDEYHLGEAQLPGHVVKQNPPAGTTVAMGEKVTLFIHTWEY